MRKLILLFLPLFLMISCAHFTSSEYPVWIDKTPSANGYLVFVGYGEGDSQKQARDSAYENALVKMGEGLGYDPREYYLRELIAYEKIGNLGSTVSDYYEENVDGIWHSWVRIDTNETSYIEARSEEYQALLDREEAIMQTMQDSLDEYRDNRDVSAINKILEAISISLEGPVENPSCTPSALRDKALEYIENLEISLRNEERDSIGVTVRLSRAKGWFHPRVEDAHILATYRIVNSSEELVETVFVSKTGDDGEFFFNSTNPLIIREGEIVFSVILDQALLESIEASSEEGFLDPILDALKQKDKTYAYHERGKLDSKSTLIVLSVIDINGQPISDRTFLDAFSSFLEIAGTSDWMIMESVDESDEEELLLSLTRQYPSIDAFIISRIGVVEFAESPMYHYARTEGYSLIYTKDDDGILSLSVNQHSFSMGAGSSYQEAQHSALENQSRISASLLLEEL